MFVQSFPFQHRTTRDHHHHTITIPNQKVGRKTIRRFYTYETHYGSTAFRAQTNNINEVTFKHKHKNNNNNNSEKQMNSIKKQKFKKKDVTNNKKQKQSQSHPKKQNFQSNLHHSLNHPENYDPPSSLTKSLYKHASIPLKTQLDFARNGHTVIRSFLSPKLLNTQIQPVLYNHHRSTQNSLSAWQQKVQVASSLPSSVVQNQCPTVASCQSKLKQLFQTSIVEIPFLQHFNTWRTNPLIETFVTSPLLASAAAILLDIPSVRLYQDALFVKHLSKDGPTPWHSDAKMAPFDTSHFITFWIPLQYIPKDGGTGLRFVDKSHVDFALPFWNDEESDEYTRLEQRYSHHEYGTCVKDHMPLNVGDVTVHAGWTLHCADAGGIINHQKMERYALAVTYVDAYAEIREEYFQRSKGKNKNYHIKRLGDAEDKLSFRDWIQDVKPRRKIDHPLIPTVWPLRPLPTKINK